MAEEVDLSTTSDKINLTTDVCKFLADRVKDPTKGAIYEAAERNKMRDEAYTDLVTGIEVLSLLAHAENGFYDVLNIAKKFNVTPSKTNSSQT